MGLIVYSFDNMGFQSCFGVPFAIGSGLTGGLSFLLAQFVGLDAVKEIQSAGAVLKMFNTDGHTLGQNAALHPLVDNDAHGVLGNVENTAGLTVVGFVGHTFLEGSVTL